MLAITYMINALARLMAAVVVALLVHLLSYREYGRPAGLVAAVVLLCQL